MSRDPGLSLIAKVYIAAVIVLGLVLLGFLRVDQLASLGISHILILSIAAIITAIAQVWRVEGSTAKSSYNLGLVVLGFSFLVLGPGAAIVVAVVACLIALAPALLMKVTPVQR